MGMTRRHRCLGLLVAVALASLCAAVQAADRVALVIGNSGYAWAPLKNPRNDAEAMVTLLESAGFQVDKQLDTDLPGLRAAVERFGTAIRAPDVKFGLFYYAGHGLQQNWRNYLVPVDARLRNGQEVPEKTVDVSSLIDYMEHAQGRNFLLILDACRDDPFAGTYTPDAKGLSQFDAPVGSLLAYATAPGTVALDGDGQNGLYTSHLLRELSVREARVEEAFKRVRLNVRLSSRGRQIPWESTSLEEDLYMFPQKRKTLTEDEIDQLLQQEMRDWQRVRLNPDITELSDFIRRYPSGYASELAQSRLSRLLLSINEQETTRMRGLTRSLLAAVQAPEPTERAANAEPPAPQGVVVPHTMALTLAPTPFFKGYAEHRRDYSQGDEYTIKVIDNFKGTASALVMKVTQVDLATERVVYNDGGFESDLMGNTTANQLGVFSTPRQFYPAELIVGKRWRTRFKQSRPNGINYTFQYDLKVVGRERITVPAGTFDTFRIEARGFNMDLQASLERTIWVAPGVNADIAQEYKVRLRNGNFNENERRELVSYVQKK